MKKQDAEKASGLVLFVNPSVFPREMKQYEGAFRVAWGVYVEIELAGFTHTIPWSNVREVRQKVAASLQPTFAKKPQAQVRAPKKSRSWTS